MFPSKMRLPFNNRVAKLMIFPSYVFKLTITKNSFRISHQIEDMNHQQLHFKKILHIPVHIEFGHQKAVIHNHGQTQQNREQIFTLKKLPAQKIVLIRSTFMEKLERKELQSNQNNFHGLIDRNSMDHLFIRYSRTQGINRLRTGPHTVKTGGS